MPRFEAGFRLKCDCKKDFLKQKGLKENEIYEYIFGNKYLFTIKDSNGKEYSLERKYKKSFTKLCFNKTTGRTELCMEL